MSEFQKIFLGSVVSVNCLCFVFYRGFSRGLIKRPQQSPFKDACRHDLYGNLPGSIEGSDCLSGLVTTSSVYSCPL